MGKNKEVVIIINMQKQKILYFIHEHTRKTYTPNIQNLKMQQLLEVDIKQVI